MTAEIERIRSIKSFPSLVKYLKEELEWKIEAEDIEDLTFEYDAEDLGLDKATAVKIREIKQLRPLVTNQPWGIFYISFEKKRLPIVALRRILRSLVLKKRASANRSGLATWNLNDLLFISSYGDDTDRELSFAHFSENSALGDLPTLKVLGWNSGNTKLRLEDTVKTLKEKLHWPDDDANTDEWRKQWASAFTRGYRETVKTSKDLAIKLADLAQVIRERVNEAISVESEKGELRKLHKAFQQALIHDLGTDDFADMYAQTIAYGLLSASVSRESGALVADNLKDMVPKTNPFLQELMGTFLTVGGRKGKIDFDELGINEVIELLRHTDMDQVKLDFGAKNPNEDPVIHFYELFLKEYDPEKRMKRGVFYTPRPVVSFIVRSVDEILRTEFGLDDGLADTTTWGEMKRRFESKSSPPYEGGVAEGRGGSLQIPEGATPETPFVQILDPATGTGTFLVEVIDSIYKTMIDKWKSQRKTEREIRELWNEYVPQHLLPRVYGFELMMAPYSIAHMKIGLKLRETGYSFISSERAKVYLTNTLEEPKDFSGYLEAMAPALAHEGQAANRVKETAPITVVIGNPPYSSSMSEGAWIMELIKDYKEGLNETKSDLNREEWKFIKFAQDRLREMPAGVLGYVVNRSYLDGVTHRRMRESLAGTFPNRTIVDLHGDVKGTAVESDFGTDQNVFEIEQGVCVSILTLAGRTPHYHSYFSLAGPRDHKYAQLQADAPFVTAGQHVNPIPEYFFWTPFGGDTKDEYEVAPKLSEIFRTYSSGIQTKRDKLTIHFNRADLQNAVAATLNGDRHHLEDAYELAVDGRDWKLHLAISDLQATGADPKNFKPILYKPFDIKWTYYTGKTKGFLAYPRREVMQHIVDKQNLGLIFNRQIVGSSISHFFVTRTINLHGTFYLGNKGQDYLAPLYLYPTKSDKVFGVSSRDPNLSKAVTEQLADRLALSFTDAGPGDLLSTIGSEDILHYLYAVFHSPTYRRRYAEFLKIDFPRIPLTNDVELFRRLCQLGCDLVSLHLLEPDFEGTSWLRDKKMFPTENHRFKFKGNDDVVAAGFPKKELAEIDENGKGKVYINKTSYFAGVPEPVWNFHIGGYQVCHKWLKDRKGRTLSNEDKLHYNKIAIALGETIRLMAEIDEVIEAHGGWPLAGSQDKP